MTTSPPGEPRVLPPRRSAVHRAGPPPDPLTRRQREVATLVGRGLTNPQIADALAISKNTVANHVATILKKLDLPSRSQMALWVTQRGLSDPE
ncbi:MAG: response regulator transcription factor [Rubrobacteraceae bacterium]